MPKSKPDEAWPMDELQTVMFAQLRESEEFQDLPPKKREKVILKLTQNTAKAIGKDLMVRSPKMLAERRKSQAQFEARNFRRWRAAFDLIETLWVCCEEFGRNFNQHFRPQAVQTEDYVFEAMTAIHARSLLVAKEVVCLVKGGFPDAALTRWRTLHELAVVGILIVDEGSELALRYLAHADVQAIKDVNSDELAADEQLQVLKARSDYGLARFGDDLKRRYGWACAIVGKKQPNFEDLEKRANKTELRNLYRYASQHVHSNHRSYDDLLGVSESNEPIALVGASNSGMVGPLTLTAFSLAEITALYLNIKPNVDRAIYTTVIMKMASRMSKLASRLEKKTLRAAQKRTRSNYSQQ